VKLHSPRLPIGSSLNSANSLSERPAATDGFMKSSSTDTAWRPGLTMATFSYSPVLGMGDSYHPLPWTLLRYDQGIGGYVVNISKEKLEGGPNYAAGSNPAWGDRAYDEKVYGYYGSPPFWGVM
jgi:hypothetical protein